MRKIETGDLVFFIDRNKFGREGSLASKFVRIGTMSKFTHVGIALIEEGETFIVEAEIPKVRKTHISEYNDYDLLCISYDKELTEEHLQYLYTHLGDPYSIWQAVLVLFNVTKLDDNKWICSEHAYRFLRLQGFTMKERLKPGDFMIECMRLPNASQRLIKFEKE